MRLADFVCFEAIIAELKAAERDGVITELIAQLDKAGRLGKGKREEITKAVIERENEASTGMGKGIAIPHVKHPAVKNMVAAIGKSTRGVDFFALDKQSVYSIILLVSPADEPDEHLHAMESIFRHLQSQRFRKFLRQSLTAEQIKELIIEADENPNL
ncbi:MAG: PTS sugar transporter subunit IIA [Sedimentisphaerales bacterium]|nr:PTS sugar transporter subunit IIA [Sedimentisphaerales bacterium]